MTDGETTPSVNMEGFSTAMTSLIQVCCLIAVEINSSSFLRTGFMLLICRNDEVQDGSFYVHDKFQVVML